MKYQIKHRYTGAVLFEAETGSLRECAEGARAYRANLSRANLSRANLYGADLYGANLSRADLSGANLSGADLYRADLYRADLSGADLYRADLYGANLSRANLYGADLSRADLSRANLSGADLYRADLYGANLDRANLYRADLYGANLSGANLYGAKGINKHICTPLTILEDQIGKIRAYKLVTRENAGPYNGGIVYEKGKTVEVKKACTDDKQQYAKGISLATLDWCMKEWREGYRILIAEFTKKDIAAIPFATDGKFRVFRCKIVGEKDLKELGLVTDEDKQTEE